MFKYCQINRMQVYMHNIRYLSLRDILSEIYSIVLHTQDDYIWSCE